VSIYKQIPEAIYETALKMSGQTSVAFTLEIVFDVIEQGQRITSQGRALGTVPGVGAEEFIEIG